MCYELVMSYGLDPANIICENSKHEMSDGRIIFGDYLKSVNQQTKSAKNKLLSLHPIHININ